MKISKRDEFYFWVKIRQDLMYSKEMKLLMRQPDGSLYFSIYIYIIMLTINSKGRLAQQVGELEMVYDLPMITQELMFFKIDTIRVAIEMLKQIGLLYTDEENVTCVSGFDNIVGSSTGWSDIKRAQREKAKQIENVDNVHTNVHAKVHGDVHASDHIEYREKSKEYRVKNKEKESFDINDINESNDSVTLPSDSELQNKIKRLKITEWHIEFSNAHLFTKYLIHGRYLEVGNLDTLQDSNTFFEMYVDNTYTFEEMKNHIQYFLLQYRKLSKSEKKKIKNKMAYLTNAIKVNQRRLEWRDSKEFIEMSNVHEKVEEDLRAEALELYPNDEVRQNIFVDEYYLSELGHEMRRIRRDFEKKTTVR